MNVPNYQDYYTTTSLIVWLVSSSDTVLNDHVLDGVEKLSLGFLISVFIGINPVSLVVTWKTWIIDSLRAPVNKGLSKSTEAYSTFDIVSIGQMITPSHACPDDNEQDEDQEIDLGDINHFLWTLKDPRWIRFDWQQERKRPIFDTAAWMAICIYVWKNV